MVNKLEFLVYVDDNIHFIPSFTLTLTISFTIVIINTFSELISFLSIPIYMTQVSMSVL